MEGVGEFSRVPEGCIAHVISLTSPRDACRLSVVSKAFHSAAASDAVWQRFLPPDFPSILSRAAAADLGSSSSKKDLFFRLCHHPLLLHAPTPMSFWLDKSSGAKCYMLLARPLSITSGDAREYWVLNRIPDARFGEVAELRDVCWLEIVGRIESSALSPKTAYAAYLVFKIAGNWWGLRRPKQETCVTLGGAESKHTVCLHPGPDAQQVKESKSFLEEIAHQIACQVSQETMDAGVIYPWTRNDCVTLGGVESKHTVCLHPEPDAQQVKESKRLLDEIAHQIACLVSQETMDAGVIYPWTRNDGWMEVEMGEFYNETGEDGEVEMSLRENRRRRSEIRGRDWKEGLIVQGIEIRPKM